MWLSNRIISHHLGVSLVDALVKWVRQSDTAHEEIRKKYIAELFNQHDYNTVAQNLTKYFASMKQMGIGVDHTLVDDVLDDWEDKEHRGKLAIQFYKGLNHGGLREGAGRKPKDGTPKVAFPVSRVAQDVADIVREYSNMTEFVENAIRHYHESKAS